MDSLSVPHINTLNRERKLLDRKYITVVLSDAQKTDLEVYRCYKCGRPVANVQNEAKAIIQAKVFAQDLTVTKLIASLCTEDNIMYLFV